MPVEHDRNQSRTVERAFELAESGRYREVGLIVQKLRGEGFETPLTDLRSRIIRRELRQACETARRGAGPGAGRLAH